LEKTTLTRRPVQQVTLLRALDDYAAAERGEKPQKHGNTVPEFDAQLRGNFYDIFRGITLHGYYTSEIRIHAGIEAANYSRRATWLRKKLGPGLGDA